MDKGRKQRDQESKTGWLKYERRVTSFENIKIYRPQYPGLCHIRTGADYQGVLVIDQSKFVGVLQCQVSQKEIQAIDIAPEYRRKGVGRALLCLAIEFFRCTQLTVRATNDKALALYWSEGFHVQEERGKCLFLCCPERPQNQETTLWMNEEGKWT